MNSLKSVIRLHKWQLDEKRRALTELQDLADRLRGELDRLKEDVQREQETARVNQEVAFGYAAFGRAAMERGRRLTESIVQVEAQIAVATDAMAEAYQDLKRFELAEEERVKREREKQRQKENTMLDETALVGFRRRQQEENSGT